MIKTILIATISLAISAFTILNYNWNIESNYSIKFSGKKAEGTFSGLKGKINFNPADLQSSVIDVVVMANTISTGNTTKDKHAKDEDWFEVIKYPVIRFTSSSFLKSGDNFIVSGVLELHGVKKQVQIPFAFSETNNSGSFMGSFKINRTDFGIKGNFFGFTVGDEFDVTLKIPVTK